MDIPSLLCTKHLALIPISQAHCMQNLLCYFHFPAYTRHVATDFIFKVTKLKTFTYCVYFQVSLNTNVCIHTTHCQF